MSVATWKRLTDLETELDKEYANDACTKSCPAGPRVHLVFAHFAAPPDVDKAMAKWRFSTLDAYGKATEPHHERPAKDYLGAHFLWTLSAGAQLDELPNLSQPVQPTADEGGTLVHFQNANFDKDKIPTKVTAKTKIPDYDMMERYAATPVGSAGTPESTNHPTRRRLCLSIPGSTGDHKDVDGSGATVSEHLNYPVPPQDGELRLLSVAAAFKFTVGGADHPLDDPWAQSTYLGDKIALGANFKNLSGDVVETSSGVTVGHFTYMQIKDKQTKAVKHEYHGLQSSGSTTTTTLAGRFSSQLKDSRVLVFKALRNIEGTCETACTYDGPKLSWGINQWIGGGELWQILAFIYDFFPKAWARRFGIFGMGVWFEGRAAAWNAHGTYTKVIIYRIPCCGPRTRAGIDAVWKGVKDAADAEAKAKAPPTAQQQKDADDKPPVAAKAMANAFAFSALDSTSFASTFMFHTAGADEDIQKAMAQWMSYRISSINPVGKSIDTVINDFLISLGSSMPATDRLAKAQASLKDELGAAGVKTALAGTFSDDGADKEWIDWPTRCKNAGKSTIGGTQQQPRTTAPTNPKAPKKTAPAKP